MEVIQYCASKKRLFFLGLAFFILMCITGIYSLSTEMNSTKTLISTGAVEIDLKELSGTTESNLLPGDKIHLKPVVNNLGIECYLRVKITYTINNKKYDELDYINGNYINWLEEDGYYYYDSTLKSGESVVLFDEISIPEDLVNSGQGTNASITYSAEAVQFKNFDGNWDEVEIKKSVDRSYDIESNGESIIIYQNEAEKDIKLEEGFFDNLGNLYPGDSVSEKIEILNSGEKEKKYLLSIRTDDLSKDAKKLLSNVNLVIKSEDGTVLSTLNMANSKRVELGKLKPGENKNITLEVMLPKTRDNDCSKMLARAVWEFLSEDIDESKETPKTGDLKFDLSIILFLISALGLLIVLILEKKEKKNIENI